VTAVSVLERLLSAPAADRGAGDAVAVEPAPELAQYAVLLLAGVPQRHTCLLSVGIEAGVEIEVGGAQWTVADVRSSDDGSTELICIYAA
jgi:hypothetical protein